MQLTFTSSACSGVAREHVSSDYVADVTVGDANIRENGNDVCKAHRTHLIVADGVGHESLPASRKWTLNMAQTAEVCRKHRTLTSVRNAIIQNCQHQLQHSRMLKDGLATTLACATLLDDQMLVVTNLGDSGVLVLRPSFELIPVFASKPQVAKYNTPYAIESNGWYLNAMHVSIEMIMPGDIVIVGSDGLFDNLTTEEIVQVVDVYRARGAKVMAVALTEAARATASSSGKSTPWSRAEAAEYGCREMPRGKPDDISVAIGVIG